MLYDHPCLTGEEDEAQTEESGVRQDMGESLSQGNGGPWMKELAQGPAVHQKQPP